jgi:hypothetical protein
VPTPAWYNNSLVLVKTDLDMAPGCAKNMSANGGLQMFQNRVVELFWRFADFDMCTVYWSLFYSTVLYSATLWFIAEQS